MTGENPVLAHTRVAAAGRQPERWLLVLHGIYGAGRNWGSIARRLTDARPEWGAVLVDLRMHGQSREGFTGPHTIAASAADVDRLVAELDLHAAAVLGHSFGGKVALTYVQHHGSELRQAWVVDSTLSPGQPQGTAWEMIEAVRSLPADFATRAEAVEGVMANGYPEGVAQWMAINLEQVEGRYRWRIDFDAMEEMLRDFFRTDLWPVVESPPDDVEVHVVKATQSTSIDAEAVARVEAAGRANGRAHLHLLEGGHWINTDNPDGVLDLLVRHLPR
jgi:pimeloyl-ACP methyl ester carboxylesterase